MVATAGKSPITAKLKQTIGKAFETHKGDETTFVGGGDLPAGINGGVAKLVDARIQEHKEGDNKGKLHLFMAGIVELPAEHAGGRTQKIMALYPKGGAFPSTVEQNVAKALNEIRKLGADTGEIAIDDLETVLAALQEEGPHFRFSTSVIEDKKKAGKPGEKKDERKPFIYHNWQGRLNNFVAGEAGGVVDETGGEGTTEPADAGDGGGEDYAAMAELADGGDGEAASKLNDACLAAGITAEQINDFPNWAAAAETLNAAGGGGGEAPAAWTPAKEEIYPYTPKGKKVRDCTVTAVFAETMNLLDMTDNKTVYKGIKWTSEPATIDGKEI